MIRPRLSARASPDKLLGAATVVVSLALLTTAVLHVPWLLGIGLFIGGCAYTLATTTVNVAAQSSLPWWVRARGLGLYLLAITGGLAVGSAMWGLVAEWSLSGALYIAAAAQLLTVFAVIRWKLVGTSGLDLSPGAPTDPVVSLMPKPTDGPVVVTVTYVVAEDDMNDFGRAMRNVEAHRRRTGAYQWGLFRDLAAPDRFVEMFHVESWAEHMRQHDRRTTRFESHLSEVHRFAQSESVVSHLLSAYSSGGLDRLDPHADHTGHTEDIDPSEDLIDDV